MHKIYNPFQKHNNQNSKFQKPYYSITSKQAGRVLDIAQSGPHQGTTIIYDGYNGDNQAFTLVQNGPDYFIKCRQGKGYLTAQNGADGARFYLSAQPGAQSRFRLDQTQPNSQEYIIYTFCGKVVDLYKGIKDNGTQVIQYPFSGKDNQIWYLNNPKNITSSSSGRD